MADITLTMDGMLLNWLKDVGDSVSSGDIIAEFEADKATVEVEAGADGTLLALNIEAGDEVDEGAVIAVIREAGEASAPKSKPQKSETPKADAPAQDAPKATSSTNGSNGASMTPDGRTKVSPLARRIAEEKGIDLRPQRLVPRLARFE